MSHYYSHGTLDQELYYALRKTLYVIDAADIRCVKAFAFYDVNCWMPLESLIRRSQWF